MALPELETPNYLNWNFLLIIACAIPSATTPTRVVLCLHIFLPEILNQTFFFFFNYYFGQLGWEQLRGSCSTTHPYSLLNLHSGTFCELHPCTAVGTSIPALLVTNLLPISGPHKCIQYTNILLHLQHLLLFSAAFSETEETSSRLKMLLQHIAKQKKRTRIKAVQREHNKGGFPFSFQTTCLLREAPAFLLDISSEVMGYNHHFLMAIRRPNL